MNTVLALAAAAEAGTGIALFAYPPIVFRLLFGADLGGAGILMGRVAGLALIGLGVACWPNASARQPLYGMVTYGTLVMLYLVYLGVRGEAVGLLLWPAAVVHAIIAMMLVGTVCRESPRGVDGSGG